MIKLARRGLPEEVRSRLEERSKLLDEALQDGKQPSDALREGYRDRDLKRELIAEANGKCIYCESKVGHVYFGDVEHIKPKLFFPNMMLAYHNLGLACALCNNAKGDYWNDELPLLNPYEDDPSTELLALGFMIIRRPGRDRARVTIDRLRLNRTELLERRKERVERLQNLADLYATAPDGELRDLLKMELCREATDDAEYAFIVRAYLQAACGLQCASSAEQILPQL
jgi:5-methylcytosine-specific restriction endonuclease McrA